MNAQPKPMGAEELWLRVRSSEDRMAVANSILEEKFEAVAAEMKKQLPYNATDQQRADWLLKYAEDHKENFRSYTYRGGVDLSRMTAAERLAVANGEKPHPVAKGSRRK